MEEEGDDSDDDMCMSRLNFTFFLLQSLWSFSVSFLLSFVVCLFSLSFPVWNNITPITFSRPKAERSSHCPISTASESRGALSDVGKRWAGEWNWHQKRRKVRQPRWWVWYHISPLSLPLLSPIPTHSHCCCSPIQHLLQIPFLSLSLASFAFSVFDQSNPCSFPCYSFLYWWTKRGEKAAYH